MLYEYQKVQGYATVLHRLQAFYAVALNPEKVKEQLDLISAWSYAHRAGNGELSHEEQEALIEHAFHKMVKGPQ